MRPFRCHSLTAIYQAVCKDGSQVFSSSHSKVLSWDSGPSLRTLSAAKGTVTLQTGLMPFSRFHASCGSVRSFYQSRSNVLAVHNSRQLWIGAINTSPDAANRQTLASAQKRQFGASENPKGNNRKRNASTATHDANNRRYSISDEQGSRIEGQCMHKLHLAAGDVHLWWLFPEDVTDEGLLEAYESLLTDGEHAHMMEGSTAAVRKERLLARVLVRTTLSRYCEGAVVPQSLSFACNHAGKPHLQWEGALTTQERGVSLHFNLSHTATLLGCAVTAGAQVGLDVEESHRHTHGDPLRLARRRFSAKEVASLEGCAEGSKRARQFVQLWTLKEAYVKAVGRGIGARPGLKAFSVSLNCSSNGKSGNGHDIIFESPEAEEQGWDFLLFQPSSQHTAALCLQRSGTLASRSSAENNSSNRDISMNGSLTEDAESSCDYGDSVSGPHSSGEAAESHSRASDEETLNGAHSSGGFTEACSNTAEGDAVPALHSQAHPSVLQEDPLSKDQHTKSGDGADRERMIESRTSNVSSGSGRNSTRSSSTGLQRRGLSSRLIAWRVVPLVSESLVRTEDMKMLGMTAV